MKAAIPGYIQYIYRYEGSNTRLYTIYIEMRAAIPGYIQYI